MNHRKKSTRRTRMSHVPGNNGPDRVFAPTVSSTAQVDENRPESEPVTKSLRQAAQIAMLRRALAAAESPDLPDKAVCDYLQTLSQMAKIEASIDVAASPIAQPPSVEAPGSISELKGKCNAMVRNEPPVPGEARAEIAALLRQAIRDIYGIDPDPTARPNQDNNPEAESGPLGSAPPDKPSNDQP